MKAARQEIGLSQEKLALRSSLDRTYIASIEKGNRNVSIQTASKIALALNVDICSLLREGVNDE